MSGSSVFRREGYDIHSDATISFTQAALGGETKIRGLTKPIILKVEIQKSMAIPYYKHFTELGSTYYCYDQFNYSEQTLICLANSPSITFVLSAVSPPDPSRSAVSSHNKVERSGNNKTE